MEPLTGKDLTAALGKDFARQDFARQIPYSDYRSELYIQPRPSKLIYTIIVGLQLKYSSENYMSNLQSLQTL